MCSEADLISKRAGILHWTEELDHGITICPYHRYKYGIHYKPSQKCGFPEHPTPSNGKLQG